jgi:hypothetical protein
MTKLLLMLVVYAAAFMIPEATARSLKCPAGRVCATPPARYLEDLRKLPPLRQERKLGATLGKVEGKSLEQDKEATEDRRKAIRASEGRRAKTLRKLKRGRQE